MSNTSQPIDSTMSTNTRQRKSNLQADVAKQDTLPKREGKAIRHDIHPPFYTTPFKKFIYTISLGAFLLALFYTWRLTQWKSNAGGWINLLMGKHPADPVSTSTGSSFSSGPASGLLEDRIRQLADDLGIHPRELASAIRPLMPTASITSIAAASPTEPGLAVSVLAEGEEDAPHDSLAAGAAKKAMGGLGAIVGLDEPVDFED